MLDLRLCTAAIFAVLTSGNVAGAEGLGGPVNLPPESFEGQQFNDNDGCAFMRAGISGSTMWVSRVDQNREPICGLAPTFGEAPVVAAVPEVEGPATVIGAPVVEPPVVAAATEDVGAPMQTVASVTTAPRVAQAAPAVAAAPVMAAEPAAPRQVTLAEACAGRTGIQSDMISSRTGQPIDCGGVPVVATVVTEPTQRHMTVAQICAETAATGQIFTNSATGQAVICPMAAPVVLAAVVEQPAASAEPLRLTRAEACELGARTGVRYIDASTGRPINCNVGLGAASTGLTVGGVEVIPPDVPSSNPTTGAVAIDSGPPRGYEPAWTDGRLNPNRGFIPISTSQYQLQQSYGTVNARNDFMPLSLSEMQAQLAPDNGVTADRISSRNVAQIEEMPAASQAVATQGRFVQVGSYGDPANANRVVAALQALGLPVGLSTITRNGAALQNVAAGPFASDAELQNALRAARAAGYGDAFIRS